jgi:fumarate hydratase subunit beta
MNISAPVLDEVIKELRVGDMITIFGHIYCGRDMVLPKIVNLAKLNRLPQAGISLPGSIIFHTAVSTAGVGPTSSNKLEIENSIEPLSAAGVKLHLGKGAIHSKTVDALQKHNAAYAIIPPVTALLNSKIMEKTIIAFAEYGMEAFFQLRVVEYPAIIAAVHGETIYKLEM